MFDSLAIRAESDTGEQSDAITKRNLNTQDSGAEDGSVINGSDDAQQEYLDVAVVMGEWTTDVRTSRFLRAVYARCLAAACATSKYL
ncbi:hypothetical protein KIN20_015163 [Parelaphostrongylus tenuis]|uniref:Uncharacterized protein n=1 Tax=Parelaphostrongylus tenuis TaxID=148309 RepID=A0AAD5MI55_PARTN|nr:hypothetical protein KIN20_015163 [Parelaphostrongylus tenuis]